MENNIRNEPPKVPVNATEIINKYRKFQDRLNFCFEKNWFHPTEVGYDANYFLLVLKGEKFYLPNNFTVNYNIGYFRSGEKLDKKYIIERMKSNTKYALYTPDICDPMKFSKPFLLKLIAFIDPNLFREIYALNKKQKAERNFNKWCDFKIEIRQDQIKDIGDFSNISKANNNRGGFRKTKNHISTNIFDYKVNPNNNLNRIYMNAQNDKNIQQNNERMFHINQQPINQQASQFMDKEVIMKDLTGNNNKNSIIKNEGFLEIGKDKNSKINEIYPKVKPIEIKAKKKE